MMFRVHALETIQRNVGINLRCRNIGVAKDRLHGAQIGSILDHMRRTRVPQHVRTGMAS